MNMNKTALDLQKRVLTLIARGVAQPTSDVEFGELARAIFAFQYEQCETYRAYCERLKLTPSTVSHWKQIPAVPTSAFKDFAIACFPVEQAIAVFHTSGTTREKAGKHFFKTLELYDAAIRPNFEAHLQPGNLRKVSLIPPDRHSSLAHMIDVVAPDAAPFRADITEPVLLLGTAFAFLNLFDQGLRAQLPAGSRVMETGGFKGRSREVSKKELYAMFEKFLDIPPARVVNEYGMTELSTQFYDQTLREGRQTDKKLAPPWSRVLMIDPNTGKEAKEGERGLIRIHDLANVWSAMCIQTEDLGVAHEDGFEVLGRAAGAEVRGCSLNAESLRRAMPR
jgi:Acyl-protein synthetase, LuxE